MTPAYDGPAPAWCRRTSSRYVAQRGRAGGQAQHRVGRARAPGARPCRRRAGHGVGGAEGDDLHQRHLAARVEPARGGAAGACVVAVATASSTEHPVCSIEQEQAVAQRRGRPGERPVGQPHGAVARPRRRGRRAGRDRRAGPGPRWCPRPTGTAPVRAPARRRGRSAGSRWWPSTITPGDEVGTSRARRPPARARARDIGRHRVAEVGDAGGAGLHGRGDLGRRRGGVPEGDHDAAADQRLDDLERSRQLGGQRHHGDAGLAGPAVDQLERRRPAATPRGARPCGTGRASAPRGAARAAPRPIHPGGGPAASTSSARAGAAGSLVITVGRNAATPYAGSAAATSQSRSGSEVRSCPAAPLTWRSTRPSSSRLMADPAAPPRSRRPAGPRARPGAGRRGRATRGTATSSPARGGRRRPRPRRTARAGTTPPPSTTVCGSTLSASVRTASATPAANRSRTATAAGSPAAAAANSAWAAGWSPDGQAAARSRSPDATVSRQPRCPHWHSAPAGSTGTCPISPAAPCRTAAQDAVDRDAGGQAGADREVDQVADRR